MANAFWLQRKICFFILFIPMLTAEPAVFAENNGTQVTLERFALIIGSNNGGKDRTLLRYATKDAVSFSHVMKEMGAVREENLILLLNPEVVEVRDQFENIRSRVETYRQKPGRKELIFYYSGHSDEEGLLLSGNHLSYSALRQIISVIQADVRVAILDSCSSGVFTRTKGVIRRPPFLLDSANEMKGYAFLTSSSENEAAQESDNIRASFFTHFLISGLRGAADTSRDGLVTLNEAYSFSFNETLARTETTQHGPQHPKYDIQLTGTGDLVLTDLRETSAGLLLTEDIEGRLYIRDSSGNLVVELNKLSGYAVELGLQPGKYQITVNSKGELFTGEVSLGEGTRTLLSRTGMKKMKGEKTIARGNEHEATDSYTDDKVDETGNTYTIMHFSLIPFLFSEESHDPNHVYTFSINLLAGSAPSIQGVQFSSIGNHAFYNVTGFQGAGIYNVTDGKLTGFQGAGIGNTAGEVTAGGQGAGIFNFSTGDVSFFQAGGIANYTGGNLSGFQAGGIINLVKGTVSGAQIAGFMNITDKAVYGCQVAGFMNRGKDIEGVQAGLINIAKDVSGVQVGLVNIADEYIAGLPVGLINIGKNGIFNIDFYHDTAGYSHVTFRLGSKHVYTLVTGALHPFSDPLLWSFGLGVGVHLPKEPFFMDIDLSCHSRNRGGIDTDATTSAGHLLPILRGTAGIQLGNKVGLCAGSSINILVPGLYREIDSDLHLDLDIPPFEEPVRLVPEFFGGVTIKIM
jgi:hypothetical protein